MRLRIAKGHSPTAAAAPPTDAEQRIDARVLQAQAARLGRDSLAAMASFGLIGAACLWALAQHQTLTASAIGLLAAAWQVLVLCGAGLCLWRSARAAQTAAEAAPDPSGDRRWMRLHRAVAVALLLVWAWGVGNVHAEMDDAAGWLALALACGVMVALGSAAFTADRLLVQLWVPGITLLPAALLGRIGLDQSAWLPAGLSLGLAVFGLAAYHYAATCSRLLADAVRARFDNEALVQRLHQQMERADQAARDKSRFLAAASHDLRQPLHALSFFGAALESRMAESSDHPLIYNMMRSIEALDKSFGAILDISRLDAQAIEPHVQVFRLRDVFRRLQMNFAGWAEEAGLQLRFHHGDRIVKSDPQLLERILGNLIQNGLRYCKRGGVTLLARNWRGGVNIEVWDTGIGIPEHELPRIFGEFYQVSNPERDRSKGLGMGLAIVQRLTLLLGHELTVQSRVGRGSLFRLHIARAKEEELEEFALGAETVPSPIEDGRTLLLIDDEEGIRASVQQLLTQWGYDVVTAATIEEAQQAALERGGLIDVVMSDLRLREGEDGLRAIERVRQACGFDVPALLVTGDTSPEQVKRMHESGHIVMFKPVAPRELYGVLKHISD